MSHRCEYGPFILWNSIYTDSLPLASSLAGNLGLLITLQMPEMPKCQNARSPEFQKTRNINYTNSPKIEVSTWQIKNCIIRMWSFELRLFGFLSWRHQLVNNNTLSFFVSPVWIRSLNYMKLYHDSMTLASPLSVI